MSHNLGSRIHLKSEVCKIILQRKKASARSEPPAAVLKVNLALSLQLRNLIFRELITWDKLIKEHFPYASLGPVILHPHESVECTLPNLELLPFIFNFLYVVKFKAVVFS